MRVLVAFDKFKDSLTSPAACALAADALRAAHPAWQIDRCPLTDGGEGFCDILTRAVGGEFEKISVTGPRGDPVDATIGFVALEKIPSAARALLNLQLSNFNFHLHRDARVAVIEMAGASGLALLATDRRDPWQTTTLGTGELLRAAARPGVAAILLGIGGSATNDLGLGALAALGLEFHSARGEKILPPVPARWREIARFGGRVAADFPPLRIACDVINPLLGPRGAAAIYGPQKGLADDDVTKLDHAAARLALMLCHHCGAPDSLIDLPGAGAAGGLGFGLMAAARAQLLPGFDLVSAWLDLAPKISAADLVITGEGRFDESSLTGKGPGAIAARAIALGKHVHVFAGAVSVPALGKADAPPRKNLTLHAITPAGTPLAQALRAAPENLAASVRRTFSSPFHPARAGSQDVT
jgi:glycerate kinase